MLFPSLQDQGGVTSFCSLLMAHISSCFEIEHLIVANRPGNKFFLNRIYYFLGDILKIINKLRKSQYDIIHLNPSFKILSFLRDTFYLIILYMLKSKKILVMFHGWNYKFADRFVKHTLLRRAFCRIYKRTSVILVLCSKFKMQLVRMGIPSQKIQVVTTMYQFTQYHSGVLERGPSLSINILFMARLIKSKGAHIVVEVGKLLLKNGCKDYSIIIAGDGPEFPYIENLIKQGSLEDYIKMVGYITGEEKWMIMKDCDIFLFPTQEEGCPVVVLEAMGMGLAVVSTQAGAIPEVVKHNENGFLVDSNDPNAYYLLVKSLLDDREMLRNICEKNKCKAENEYEANIVTKKIESFYQAILERE